MTASLECTILRESASTQGLWKTLLLEPKATIVPSQEVNHNSAGFFVCLFFQTRQSIVHDTASLTLSYVKMEIKETFWTQLPWKSRHFLTREPNGSQNMMKKVFEGHNNNNNWTASATALDSIHYYQGTKVCEEEKVSVTHFKSYIFTFWFWNYFFLMVIL